MLPSKFEASLMLHFSIRSASSSLFPLVSSCPNDYFFVYMIIDLHTNCLFPKWLRIEKQLGGPGY